MTIDLGPCHNREVIGFTSAEVVTEPLLPLVLVEYSVNGRPGRRGARLDLDKQCFLDREAEPAVDALLASLAPQIAGFIAGRMPF